MRRESRVFRKLITSVAVAGCMVSLVACGNDSGSGDTVNITYWSPRGEDSSLYEQYEDNPIIKYIEENYKFNDKKLHFEFYIAPPGSEADNFSNLLGTGDYCDVMDMSMASSTAPELYEDDIIWDLTELVPANMPNYMAFLEANPDCESSIYSIVDGEKKILMLRGFSDGIQPMFQGFCYRRDWIAKYGTNPQTGAAFTYGFTDENDFESWEDDVVFPNGTDEPLYISDWEWMFEIFEKAMEEQGISDGYCYSPYYYGYMQTGDLFTGFGGGAPYWYNDNGTCVNGIETDSFRAYLQCLNTWYQKGWLDKSFSEHTSDVFFAVDAPKVFQGKVGLWQGRISTVGTQIDADDAYTDGAVVYGCRQPINDIYGGPEQQNKEPDHMYQFGKDGNGVVLTKKMSEEQVVTFLKFADFMFSEEGTLLQSGLSKEQYEASQDEFYTRLGLTEGMYTIVEEDGREILKYNMDTSDTAFNAAILSRVQPVLQKVENVDRGYDRYMKQATESWDYYENTASLSYGVMNAVNVEDAQTITKVRANYDQFLIRTVPFMIKGSGYDIWDDASWEQFLGDVNKYQAGTVTEIYQKAIDLMEK